MKRKLVKENLNTRLNSLRKQLREGNGLVVGLNKKIDALRKLFREGNRSTVDLKALKDVQSQFDNLIGLMTNTKLLLAELAIGGDEVWAENSTSSEWEEGEFE
jgi:ADP-dependent phosphofructokinase/glucokinase